MRQLLVSKHLGTVCIPLTATLRLSDMLTGLSQSESVIYNQPKTGCHSINVNITTSCLNTYLLGLIPISYISATALTKKNNNDLGT